MRILALYDIHGKVDALDAVLADPRAAGPDAVVVGGDAVPGPYAAATGRAMLAAGWPDERSLNAALIEPLEPMVVTKIFEGMAGG